MKNYPGFYSPEYEEILEKSLTTSDREERFKYLKKAESILVEAMPLTAIYHWKNAYLIQDNIKYFDHNKGGGCCFHRVVIEKKPILDGLDNYQNATPSLGTTSF